MESSFALSGSGEETSASTSAASETASTADGSDGSSATSSESVDSAADGDSDQDSGQSSDSADETASEESTADDDSDGSEDDASSTASSESEQQPSPAVAVTRVSAEQATRNLQSGDAVSTQRAVQGLNLPELSGRSTPSVQSISGFLQQLRQQASNR